MDEEDIEAKKEFVVTFFNNYSKKNSSLHRMLDQGFIEEALILACCYICALANHRYGMSNERDNFIKIIYEHSDNKNLFSKISWIDFYKNGKDPIERIKKGKPIANYKNIKAALLKIFDKKSDHHQEMDKNGLIDHLKDQKPSIDFRNSEANLDNFSYAAVLYEKYRSAGVHEGGMAHSWDAETGKPLFIRNEQGEDIYYNGNTLCFSKEIILTTLKNVHHNLKKQCLSAIKWPHEL